MRLLTFKMGWLLGVNVVNNMYTGFRLSSTQQPGWSAQLGNQNISHQYWWTSTGCVSKRESSTNSVFWCSKCKHSLAPAYLSEQLQQVMQLESRQRLRSSSSSAFVVPATRRSTSVIDLSLLPAPGLGLVCRPLSLQHPLCHHSVNTWNLIFSQSRYHHDDNFSWLTRHVTV